MTQFNKDAPESRHTAAADNHAPGSSGNPDLETLVPDGHVVLATIAEPTQPNGTTPVQLSTQNDPFYLVHAASLRVFDATDIGKTVACVRIAGSTQIMIMGLLASALPDDVQASAGQYKILNEILAARLQPSAEAVGNDLQTNDPHANESNGAADEIEEEVVEEIIVFDDDYDESPRNLHAEIEDESSPDDLVLKAKHSIKLKCGATSLVLMADGRIKVNGKYIHSRATHVQRITGGSVKIN